MKSTVLFLIFSSLIFGSSFGQKEENLSDKENKVYVTKLESAKKISSTSNKMEVKAEKKEVNSNDQKNSQPDELSDETTSKDFDSIKEIENVLVSFNEISDRFVYSFINQKDIPEEKVERFTIRVDQLYDNIDSVNFDYDNRVFSIEFLSSPSEEELESVFRHFKVYEYTLN